MNKEMATKVFESLASGIRLDVWRLLVKAGLRRGIELGISRG